jgi:hypothetical protein
MPTILSVSQDETLLATRTEVLSRCHADVVPAKAKEAKALLKDQRFDVVVLCQSLSQEDIDELVSIANQMTSNGRVLEILKIEDLPWGYSSTGGNATVPSQARALVEKVTEILKAMRQAPR